jgi:putative ABC transport system substrate-binding protein
MKRIGFLNSGTSLAFEKCVDAFKDGLRQAGLTVGVDVAIEYKWADGEYRKLGRLAGELVALDVDLIAASGGVTPAKVAQNVASTIPLVFVCGFDPADARVGLVSDLERPGGNATGVNVFNTELLPQRREQLGSFAPDRTLALLLNPNIYLARTGIEQGKVPDLQVLNAASRDELEGQFDTAAKQNLALLVDADPYFTSEKEFIVELAKRFNVPASYPWREFADVGGLMSYGTSLTNPYRQMGVYAGMILKGEQPGNLPVLQPTSFELVLNATTAMGLLGGRALPPRLLARADRVIE